MPTPSTIQILHNDTLDITKFCVFAQTRFESQMSAIPGTGTVVLKDSNRELDFSTGDRITLVIDGIKQWGGLIMAISQGHFFPVVDTTDLTTVTDRMWTLECTDFNIYMAKRVLRDPSNYLSIITVPPMNVGAAVRYAIPRYMDVPPGFDYTTHVQDVDFIWDDGNGGAAPLPGSGTSQQGTTWQYVLDSMASQAGYQYRVDADLALHFGLLEELRSAWGFTDAHPDGVKSIGFREGTVRQDSSQMVTDALVWGGHDWQLQDNPPLVFARYPDPPANDEVTNGITFTKEREQSAIDAQTRYGRWQRAEMHINELGYFAFPDVFTRAATIVAGPTGTIHAPGSDMDGLDSGLDVPLWQVSLSWFAHDVPDAQHLVAGSIVPLSFYSLADDPQKGYPLLLPLRSLSISFPTLPPKLPGADPLTYVRFDGQFGIQYSDTRFLWRYLFKNRGIPNSQPISSADNATTSVKPGTYGTFYPENTDGTAQLPNGTRRQFRIPFSYIAGTTEVYLNGLLQRPRYEYVETSPSQGLITFATAPLDTDTVWVNCRTGSS